MEFAGSAIGIASLGIQVCQGLLSYYDGWRDYESDTKNTYAIINDLSRTLTVLKASLESKELNEEKRDRVKRCLLSCEDDLFKLSNKLQKLHKHNEPTGFRQKAFSEIQRAWYPVRSSTLAKLREVVGDTQERLKLAMQALQLDVSTNSQRILTQVAADTSNIAARVEATELHTQRILLLQQCEQLRQITDWLSPPDHWSNHKSARQRHEPKTCAWLLQSDQYQSWKAGSIQQLWIYGKPGCGKTILSSIAIEDFRAYCEGNTAIGHAYFYFSFSDNQKQSYESLLRSLVMQLGSKEPGLSMLQQAYDKYSRHPLNPSELEKTLLSLIDPYEEVFLLLDALDESPEEDEVRQTLLGALEQLAQGVPKLRMLITSRDLRDIRESMEARRAELMPVNSRSVNEDIRIYVSTQLACDRRMSRLDSTTKALIEQAISERADGMFRWAYCQLQELKKLKSTKPKYIKEALRTLPPTLDGTYQRILEGIEEMFRREAITLLYWLAYAQSPPTLGQLVEAAIIDPTTDENVEESERGGLRDTLDILSGLVTIQGADAEDDDGSHVSSQSSGSNVYDDEDVDSVTSLHSQHLSMETKVRLAHFSVKEYLESERILQSPIREFFLDSAQGHRFLAQSCLVYLMHYVRSSQRRSDPQDFVTFPLLWYSARSWGYHSSLQQPGDVTREISLLGSEEATLAWLLVYCPDECLGRAFATPKHMLSAVYLASSLGLEAVVSNLLEGGADVDGRDGYYGVNADANPSIITPLYAASRNGHEKVVQILLDGGADINLGDGHYALHGAMRHGHEMIVQMLLDRETDVNACGEYPHTIPLADASQNKHEKVVQTLLNDGPDVNRRDGYNPLCVASENGHEKVAQLLLDRGADVNACGGDTETTALFNASQNGHDKVVQILLNRGANVHTRQGPRNSTALYQASCRGHEKVVQMLLESGADANYREDYLDSTVLWEASCEGHQKIVKMLLEGGADVNARAGSFDSTALWEASYEGHEKVVQVLLDSGADVNARVRYVRNPRYRKEYPEGPCYTTALYQASRLGYTKVVQMLLDCGAEVNARGYSNVTALWEASYFGHEKVVQMLLDRGAEVDARGCAETTALREASHFGHEKVVQMLLDGGADVNVRSGEEETTALLEASRDGYEKIVQMLLERGADVHTCGYAQRPALWEASHFGHEKAVQVLLDWGADVNARGGWYKYQRPSRRSKGFCYTTALWEASHFGHAKVVQMLLDRGADVNVRCGKEKTTALFEASDYGHDEVVKMLIGAGADAGGGDDKVESDDEAESDDEVGGDGPEFSGAEAIQETGV